MGIIRTDIENGFTLACKSLTVTITNDGRFFTVYEGDMPVATITRPLVLGPVRDWMLHDTNGVLIAKGVGPRYCFARFVNYWYR